MICRLLCRLLDRYIADCPPELSPCESCRVTNCLQVDWESCDRRMAEIESAKKGAGK